MYVTKHFSFGILLLTLACGGDNGDGNAVSGTTKLTSITATQAQALCRSLVDYDYAHYVIENDCTEQAVGETNSLSTCQTFVAVCVKESNAKREAKRQDDLAKCTQLKQPNVPPNCTATAAEFEQCYKDAINADARAARTSSCTRAGKEISSLDNTELNSPACEHLFATCGEIL